MHAFLVTGGTKEMRVKEIEARRTAWQVAETDTITVIPEGASIGIAHVRILEGKLALKPYQSPLTLAIIEDAHTLTLEAQQALLKTLEEPPVHARILLETDNAHALLPTILSRCHLMQFPSETRFDAETMFQCFKTLEQVASLRFGERLRLSATIAKNRQEALAWIEVTMEAVHAHLPSSPSENNHKSGDTALSLHQTAHTLRLLLTARQQLLGNVNPALILDTLFLSVSE